MRTDHYILDAAGNAVPCDDWLTWARWFEASRETRRIAHDKDEGPDALPITVSTVFLGLDHRFGGKGPPLLWETLVFGGLLDGEMRRYTSREAALRGHQTMCRRVRESLK